jgi:hypothetical protein
MPKTKVSTLSINQCQVENNNVVEKVYLADIVKESIESDQMSNLIHRYEGSLIASLDSDCRLSGPSIPREQTV